MPATAQVFGFGLPAPLRTLLAQYQHRRALSATDRALARRFQAAFETPPASVFGLTLYVHNRAVSVYGAVASEADREAVLALAAAQPGVRRIVDHLTLAEA